jgi:hypothetical protein
MLWRNPHTFGCACQVVTEEPKSKSRGRSRSVIVGDCSADIDTARQLQNFMKAESVETKRHIAYSKFPSLQAEVPRHSLLAAPLYTLAENSDATYTKRRNSTVIPLNHA